MPIERLLQAPRAIAGGVPEGLDALLLGALARRAPRRDAGVPILHVARDGTRLATLEEALRFFAPDVEVLSFPAWDGVPYDRVAPNAETIARAHRHACRARRSCARREDASHRSDHRQCHRAEGPAADFITAASLTLQPGNVIGMRTLIERLEISGYARAGTVTDPGQYAVRGGILDLYPPGGEPVRLDFFGDTLEQLRAFDPSTQRTRGAARNRFIFFP